MSTDTIKLSSVQGDKYIAPQQTLTYKNVTLFGYGYLDWGTVVNQSIINLMDSIDALQDSGLSEIKFDLTEYEENQKILRAEEFNTWKTGFTQTLKDLVADYIAATKSDIEKFTTAQNTINIEVKKEISDNFNFLSDEIDGITSTLDEKILQIVTDQISSVTKTINTLNDNVQKSTNLITEAIESANTVLTTAKQLIQNFKDEFSKTFESFKTETTDALTTNKEYLIKYIDTLIGKTNQTTTDLEARITNLELISEGLSLDTVRTLIIQKVNDIAIGVINTALTNYETRLTNIEGSITTINNNLPTMIKDKVDAATATINNTIAAYDSSLKTLNKAVQTLSNDVGPIEGMRETFINDFGSIENMIEYINDAVSQSHELFASTISESKEYRALAKHILENVLAQNAKNSERMVAFINATILNLLDGFNLTAFNELALIQRSTSKTDLFNNINSEVATNLLTYGLQEFKYNFVSADLALKHIEFSFKLPRNIIYQWGVYGITITNTRTNEKIESIFQATNNLFNIVNIDKMEGHYVGDEVPTSKINVFQYSFESNNSSKIIAKFADLASTDTIKVEIFSDVGRTSKLIESSVGVSDMSYPEVTDRYKNVIYPNLYKIDENISKPSATVQNITWSNTNDKVLVPVCQIQTKPDGSKIIALKVKLPNNATLTNIIINDGVSSTTRVFTNQSTFPLTELEYAARNLVTTNNYYKDICSTGLIGFVIDSSAKKVTGTITYVLNGVTKTYDISTSSSGGGSETHIQDSTVGSGAYVDYSMSSLFGAGTDANNIMVEVRVLETNTTSDVYNKYLKADHLTSVVWMDTDKIRIYNEYNVSLTLRTIFKS